MTNDLGMVEDSNNQLVVLSISRYYLTLSKYDDYNQGPGKRSFTGTLFSPQCVKVIRFSFNQFETSTLKYNLEDETLSAPPRSVLDYYFCKGLA
jgi:hypothetical protein